MKKCKVICITTGQEFDTIDAAARFAGAKRWTMGVKMETAGGFIDSEGREYRRESPMETKNQYSNTGKELQVVKNEYTRTVEPKQMDVSEVLWAKIAEICENAGCWKEVKALLDVLEILTTEK